MRAARILLAGMMVMPSYGLMVKKASDQRGILTAGGTPSNVEPFGRPGLKCRRKRPCHGAPLPPRLTKQTLPRSAANTWTRISEGGLSAAYPPSPLKNLSGATAFNEGSRHYGRKPKAPDLPRTPSVPDLPTNERSRVLFVMTSISVFGPQAARLSSTLALALALALAIATPTVADHKGPHIRLSPV